MKLNQSSLTIKVVATVATWASLTTCALAEVKTPSSVWVLTESNHLVNVNPSTPSTVVQSVALSGLESGDDIVGIDYRVAYGDMYALAQSGRIYLINTSTGQAVLVNGSEPVSYLQGKTFGFDFNPAADKLRVVGNGDLNLRLHPDNGSVVDFDKKAAGLQIDPALAFAPSDSHFGAKPDIVAAAYTYNTANEKLTTNYAIDRHLNALLMQGTKEGVKPSVSPNLGVLYTIGNLGLGDVTDASMDISDINNIALAAVTIKSQTETLLVSIDLETGKATSLGVLGNGDKVKGFAIEP